MAVTVELRVIHLLVSKLCHDLVGPVGAVNNGVELMREFGSGNDDEAMDLVASSASQAAEKLKFFRVAYGLAAGTARTIGDARGLVACIIEPGRMTLDWPEDASVESTMLDEGSVKLLLNMIMLAAEALSPKGTIAMDLAPGDLGITAQIAATGEGAHLEEETLASLSRNISADDLTPRSVQGYFSARLAEDQGTELTVDSAVGTVKLSANLRFGA